MRTLLIESSPGIGHEVAVDLQAAGHEVARCHEDGAATFPCRALVGGTCPLEGDGSVRAAVLVRGDASPEKSFDEAAVTCAMRQRVPVLVVGEGPDPFDGWVREQLPGEAVAHALERVVAAAASARAERLRSVARSVLATHGLGDLDAVVTVRRSTRGARISVRVPSSVPRDVRNVVATRVHAVDRSAGWGESVVDIDVHS